MVNISGPEIKGICEKCPWKEQWESRVAIFVALVLSLYLAETAPSSQVELDVDACFVWGTLARFRQSSNERHPGTIPGSLPSWISSSTTKK